MVVRWPCYVTVWLDQARDLNQSIGDLRVPVHPQKQRRGLRGDFLLIFLFRLFSFRSNANHHQAPLPFLLFSLLFSASSFTALCFLSSARASAHAPCLINTLESPYNQPMSVQGRRLAPTAAAAAAAVDNHRPPDHLLLALLEEAVHGRPLILVRRLRLREVRAVARVLRLVPLPEAQRDVERRRVEGRGGRNNGGRGRCHHLLDFSLGLDFSLLLGLLLCGTEPGRRRRERGRRRERQGLLDLRLRLGEQPVVLCCVGGWMGGWVGVSVCMPVCACPTTSRISICRMPIGTTPRLLSS